MLVETDVPAFSRRSRSLVLSHRAAGLPRGLEPGEVVVVRDGEHHWTGCVADVDFTLDDTVYRLSLGGVVPAEQARALLAGREGCGRPARVEVADVVALLGSLRDPVRVPAQRVPGRLVAEG